MVSRRLGRSKGVRYAAVTALALVISGGLASAVGAHPSARSQAAPAPFVNLTTPGKFQTLFTGAVGTAAGFEDDDGNLAHDTLMDWNDFSPTTWTGTAPYRVSTKTSGAWTFYGKEDDTVSTSDSGFAGGTKEDDECPTVIGSKAPNKDDLARIYIAGENLGGKVYLMLAWVRIPQNSTSSDEHVAFEFNQGTTACASGGLVHRTAGDLLIIYDFTGGGTPTFSISRWVTSGSCEVGADSPPCWGPQATLTAAEGAVNTGGSVSDTISPSSPTAVTLGTSEFGEAGINLSDAVFNLTGGRACERFGTGFAVSRSSGSSATAQMEDLVGPINVDLSNCVTPGITTTPSTGALGGHLNDTADLSGGNSPTGNVTFKLYGPSDQTCSGTALYTETANLSGTHAFTTGGPVATAAGTYHWTATYNGDGNNNPVTSTCASEAVTVAKATPTLTTTASASVTVGSAIHDTAHLTGGFGTLTGTITFSVYAPGDTTCSTPLTPAPTSATVSGTGSYDSGTFTTAAVGTYRWIAHYSGDANNNAVDTACNDSGESSAVGKATPTLTTTASGGVNVGAAIHDTAHLSGGFGTLGGTISFSVYAPGDTTCQTPLTPAPTSAAVSGAGNYDSGNFTTSAVGDYRWIAHYSGDANNNAVDTACNDAGESSAVGKVSPTIATSLSSTEVLIGSSVHDSSKLTGATADAGGSVTYTVYTNSTCTAGATDAGTKTVAGGTVPDSNAVSFPTAGTFYWKAVYSGDANNNGATSACTDETLLVDRPAISITKNPKAQAIDSGGTASFTITVTNTGTVTLTNVAVTDALAPGCAKSIGTLTAGQSTSYTCTLSAVTAAFTNVATATGHPPVGPDVTASDSAGVTVSAVPPPPPPPAPPAPAPTIDLQITKTAAPASVTVGSQVTWTLTVKNNGPSNATGVTVADPIPAGFTFVSAATTQGTCTGGAMLSCAIGAMANGATVTVTLVTTANTAGSVLNTATVVGNESETNTANNTSSAPAAAKGPFVPPAAPVCTALGVTPKQLLAGRKSTLTLKVTQKGKAIPGIRVQIIGSTLRIVTTPSNSKGIVKRVVRPLKAGIVTFRPVAQKSCRNARVGVIGVFTPPVTG